MDYSNIAVATRALEVAGIPVPTSEEEIRRVAYEYLEDRDFLAAHSIRLGRNYREFTRDDWVEVISLSGEVAVKSNIAAFIACLHHGLIK